MSNQWIHEYAPLAPLTTLGIGGPARFLAEARNESQILDALAFASGRRLPVFVLGGGSNILVSDAGFPGLVLRVALSGIKPGGEGGRVTVGAGEDWDCLVEWTVGRDWAGAECLSGIPGTVGGTPVQNVGAYGEEVSEIITSVRALDRESEKIVELGNADCGFTYRTSIFNSTARDRYIVLTVAFAFRVGDHPRTHYPDLQRFFAGKSRPSLAEVRGAVREIRAGKAMLIVPGDPDCRSAGSFFKNPIVDAPVVARVEEAARRLGCMKREEEMPVFKASAGKVKLAAAWLIERSGFHKGYTRGRVGLSAKHTLALVNRGGATASEVLELMRTIQDRVEHTFGISLTPEPVFVGFNSP